MTPPVGFHPAAQAASHIALGTQGQHGNALPHGAQGQHGSALPQAAGGPAGPGPSPRVSPYFSRRSPSPLPMRQHPGQSY